MLVKTVKPVKEAVERNRFQLKKAKDQKKDQTYFLYALNSDQLSKVIFPLGDYEKPEVKEISAAPAFRGLTAITGP